MTADIPDQTTNTGIYPAAGGYAAPNVRNWASEIDDGTIRQAATTGRLPILAGPVALMPDAHLGYGCAVGSVIATTGAIIPSAVGVDIGCGMTAALTDLTADDLPDTLTPLLDQIVSAVPAGVGKAHTESTKTAGRWFDQHGYPDRADSGLRAKALRQFGTLGSGNHFAEVSLDEQGRVWVVLHSGSRNVGKELAELHIEGASRDFHDVVTGVRLEDADLAWLVQGTPAFDAYIADLHWAQAYAYGNRDAMFEAMCTVLFRFVGRGRVRDVVRCFTGDTAIVTRDGEYRLDELAGRTVTVLTEGGEWVDAPISSFGVQPTYEIELRRYNERKVIRATAEHRWFVRLHYKPGRCKETTTTQLMPGDRLETVFPKRNAWVSPDRLGVARGFVFGDGSANGRSTRIDFYGEKDQHLLAYFDGLGGARLTYHYIYDPSTQMAQHIRRGADTSGASGSYIRINQLPASWKGLPDLDEHDDDFLYGWVSGYFAADGDVGKSGRATITSSEQRHLEHVKAILTRLGIWTYPIRCQFRKGIQGVARPLYYMGISRSDLDRDFFIVPEHRERWESGRDAAERRSWTVISVKPTGMSEEVFCATVPGTHSFALAGFILTGNCHHNYAVSETHLIDGEMRDVWVTRKGAVSARAGERGIIPGSMGTDTFIVEGLGSEASWQSCSHGAGRRMSRNQARKRLDVDEFVEQMRGRTWLDGQSKRLIDEAPGAYKSIEAVMADQADLVRPLHRLEAILNYKG